jgi:hypothetical protein
VDITVPKHFVVGATGVLVRSQDQDDTKTESYHADDVIDFGRPAPITKRPPAAQAMSKSHCSISRRTKNTSNDSLTAQPELASLARLGI